MPTWTIRANPTATAIERRAASAPLQALLRPAHRDLDDAMPAGVDRRPGGA